MTYASALLAAYALKAYYSQATVADLGWILAPTATLVGWAGGEPLMPVAAQGWMAADGRFVIAPACAGVNFLILVFGVAVLGFVHRLRTVAQRWSWFVLAATTAYVLTIAINALRIVAAVGLYDADVHAGWLTPERAHRLVGTIIYLAAVWAVWLGCDRLAPHDDHAIARPWTALCVPAAYIATTVVVPFLNGAWQQFGSHYLEHAITVSLVAAATVPLLSLVRWVTSGPPLARGEHHGQTDDSGGRRRAGDC